MMEATVYLAWPSRDLSPNARVHWGQLGRARKEARRQGFMMASHIVRRQLAGARRLTAQVVIHPPDRRRRDIDNILASLKSHFDGIADALGIDDSKWSWAAPVVDEPIEQGKILVKLAGEAAP